LISQSSPAAEAFVIDQLQRAIEDAVDIAAINGSGSAPIPTGIMNLSGLLAVEHGTNGGNTTWAKIVEFIGKLEDANAARGNLAWLGTPLLKADLMAREKASNTAQFIMSEAASLAGYSAHWSTHVPKDLTKGSGTALHGLIFGNFADLLIGNWAGVDLVVNTHRAKEGLREIVVNSFWDIAARHDASFAVAKDISIA
jgi:HK97 family phage major capsid protein